MITHRDELHGIAPGATAPTLAGYHVRPEVVESMRRRLVADGWRDVTVVPCRACAERAPLPVAA